jgi:single-strand DNA-binding protein
VSDSLNKGSRVVVSGRLEQRSWETDQGEKRYAFEIVADDVAASLLFGTAEITKNERREGGAPASAGAPSSGGAATSAPAPSGGGYDPAEEPF